MFGICVIIFKLVPEMIQLITYSLLIVIDATLAYEAK